MVPGFFENLRDYSEIKLRILSKFLTPWSAKLGSMARRGSGEIWYVDGFAGEGRYKDGRDGSPVVGLRRASQALKEDRGYDLACFFVEKSRNRWASLDRISEGFRRGGVTVHNKRGEFSQYVLEIASTTQGSALLLFVDPFGISPLKYELFKPLLTRASPLDLILTFQHRALHRLAKDYPHLISEAIGNEGWKDTWDSIADTAAQTRHIFDIFRQNLLEDGRFLEVFFYPIRVSINSAPKYYLVFASRHYDAFELWNDQVALEETNLSRKTYDTLVSQASFLPAFDAEFQAVSLLNEVRALAHSMERVTRRDIIMWLVRNRWGQYQTGGMKKAVASMVRSGELMREHGSGKSIDDDYMYLT